MSLMPYHNQKRKGWVDPFTELENIQKQMSQMFDVAFARNPLTDVFFQAGSGCRALTSVRIRIR